MTSSSPLSPEQRYALLDVLTHEATYREIEQFKSPETIHKYGPPFQDDIKPTTPILQGLVTKCALTLPGLRDVSPDFWKVQVESLINDLAEADLSESYDKGNLGIRKTLATAVSSLLEYPARGMLGSFSKDDGAFGDRTYDVGNADDVLVAWQHFLQRVVYSDYLDTLYRRASETDQLSEHDTLTQAAHEFIVVNLASFMHYTLILSPEGSNLVRLIDNVNKLAPYTLARQTLRIGNVATMINGMMKLLLAKMSIGSITNWMGFSSGADEGMNLLQQIISTILGWDKRDFKKRLEKIDKDKQGPSVEVKTTLNEWVCEKGRDEHIETRSMSRQNKMSMVQTILALSSTDPDMSELQHAAASEYLALKLSVRDRNELIRVLCRSNPDNLTQAIRDAVAAYEPIIRQVHQAVDLSDTVTDFQNFVNDMLKLCKPQKPMAGQDATSISVEDFVDLLHKHQRSSHKFLHQVTKNGSEIAEWFRKWCEDTAVIFRQEDGGTVVHRRFMDKLEACFSELSAEDQAKVKTELDAYAKYLDGIHQGSAARIREVVQNVTARQQAVKAKPSDPSQLTMSNEHKDASQRQTMYGPGAYLAKWQHLLDSTIITPQEPFGPLRDGADLGVKENSERTNDGSADQSGIAREDKDKLLKKDRPTHTDNILALLGDKFQSILKGDA